MLDIILPPNKMAKAIITKLVEFLKAEGVPHLSPNNIATYLCHLAGQCPTLASFKQRNS